MATKTSKKKTVNKRKPAPKAEKTPAPSRNKTIRECMNESEVLHFHMRIITVLSIVVCVLVGVILYLALH
ncbi:hypothetical protein IKF63_02075 [Candidatus Saccharibacteria bacterium]|nr:hypothetical protein [Candidatus Saccharibacteria bacterium]